MCTKLKTLLMAMILAGFASQNAVAENFINEDMAFAFGDSSSSVSTTDYAQIDLLSNEEMMATEGEVFPFWLLGAAIRFSANPWVRHHAANFALGYGVYSWSSRHHRGR